MGHVWNEFCSPYALCSAAGKLDCHFEEITSMLNHWRQKVCKARSNLKPTLNFFMDIKNVKPFFNTVLSWWLHLWIYMYIHLLSMHITRRFIQYGGDVYFSSSPFQLSFCCSHSYTTMALDFARKSYAKQMVLLQWFNLFFFHFKSK